MVGVCVAGNLSTLIDFVVTKLCTVTETFLTLVASENTRDMDMLIKVHTITHHHVMSQFTGLDTCCSVCAEAVAASASLAFQPYSHTDQ